MRKVKDTKANTNLQKIWEKIDSEATNVCKDKDCHFLKVKWSIYEDDIATLNSYAVNKLKKN